MEKIKQETVNFTEKNIDRIAALFPSVITETKDADGKLKRVVNFDQLKQLLSEIWSNGVRMLRVHHGWGKAIHH